MEVFRSIKVYRRGLIEVILQEAIHVLYECPIGLLQDSYRSRSITVYKTL